jgi:hypothetical protein
MNFLSSTQREYICKKWLPFEIVLGVWNFSVVLQNVCFDKLNVFRLCTLYIHVICFCLCTLYIHVICFCLCTLYIHVICFCICICLWFSLKINKLHKKKFDFGLYLFFHSGVMPLFALTGNGADPCSMEIFLHLFSMILWRRLVISQVGFIWSIFLLYRQGGLEMCLLLPLF